jgi:hypothetical protein
VVVSAGLENCFAGCPTALQQIEESRGIIQEETDQQHPSRVLFVFTDHEEVVTMVEVGLARALIGEGTAAEMIDDTLW